MQNLRNSLKIAVADVRKSTRSTTRLHTVNLRNAIELSGLIGADLYTTHAQLLHGQSDYDVIILGFCSKSQDIAGIQDFVNRNTHAALVVMCGEYEQGMQIIPYYTNRPFHVIRNYEGPLKVKPQRLVKGDYFLNINLLVASQPNELTEKKYDCVYYGRWRPDRVDSYVKYIHGIHLSSSVKNLKMYYYAGCHPLKNIDNLDWDKGRETLNLFRYSLYIEDNYTHKHYNCLANRWYEAGFCNNVVFFDSDCMNTVRRSEIGAFTEQIKPYIVHNSEELHQKIKECNKDFEYHLAVQKCWRTGEMLLKRKMIEEFCRILTKINNYAKE